MSGRKELIDYDPVSGMKTYFVDTLDGKFQIRHEQDVAQVLELNKKLQNLDELKKDGIKKGFWWVAYIPDIVTMEWMKEGINIFDKNATPAIKRKLMDPQYRYLRTSLGKL